MYFTFDTETTGLEPGSRLVEIHSTQLDPNGQVIGQFHDLINPGMPIPADAAAIHGITTEEVGGARPAHLVLADWMSWIDATERKFGIAHNAPYDVGIIGWELGRAGLSSPDIQVIDTCAMARAIKATAKNSLDALVAHYGITRRGKAHRAPSDSMACADYWRIASKLTDENPRPWTPEYRYTTSLPDVLSGLPEAVASGIPIAFDYVDAKGNRTHRNVIPYGWAETEHGLMFHGLCAAKNERRTFRADRVEVKG